MEEIEYVFDSYAIVEILKKNEKYNPYLEYDVYMTVYNLAEIYYSVLNEHGEEKANIVFDKYRDCVCEIEDDVLKEAMKFRKEHKKQDISYADAIGHTYAKMHSMKFLTGDKEFELMENVEFVK
ncbi:hypothetical protein J4233_04430 [Candidatus Pacearchaeota archaeon]|nr:hypothetical protein [Candidatus Pacearchaeota archaeon]